VGGLAIITAACEPREPHDAYGRYGGPPPGQWYENVDPEAVLEAMQAPHQKWEWSSSVLDRGDVRVAAWT
jgi:hypothetical protein